MGVGRHQEAPHPWPGRHAGAPERLGVYLGLSCLDAGVAQAGQTAMVERRPADTVVLGLEEHLTGRFVGEKIEREALYRPPRTARTAAAGSHLQVG